MKLNAFLLGACAAVVACVVLFSFNSCKKEPKDVELLVTVLDTNETFVQGATVTFYVDSTNVNKGQVFDPSLPDIQITNKDGKAKFVYKSAILIDVDVVFGSRQRKAFVLLNHGDRTERTIRLPRQ